MGIASILTAVGGLAQGASGIASIFSKGKKIPGPEAQSNDRMREIHRTPHYIVEGAKAAGIHPLVAFGSNFTSSIGAPVYDSFGTGSNIGAGLDGLAAGASALGGYYQGEEDRARAEQRSDERDMLQSLADEKNQLFTSKQIELLDAQIQESRSRSLLDAARAGAIGGVGGPGKTLVGPGGVTFNPVPGRTSAQDAEDQYGEGGDLLFGTGGLIEDLSSGRIHVPANPVGNLETRWNNWLKEKTGGWLGY